MSKQTGRNDSYYCGSGNKNCCMDKNNYSFAEYPIRDMQEVDYVERNIDRDWLFLSFALQNTLGNKGYSYCRDLEVKGISDEELIDVLKEAVKNDVLDVYNNTDKNKMNWHLQDSRAYGAEYSEMINENELSSAEEDIGSLLRKNAISKYQPLLFHIYVLDNIQRRFDDYFYAPSQKWIKGQHYGTCAHRGYDFLIGMSLYIELQLGVHLIDPGYVLAHGEKERFVRKYLFDLIDSRDVTDSMVVFIHSYFEAISAATHDYQPEKELLFYKSIGAINDRDFRSRINLINEDNINTLKMTQGYSYFRYLLLMVGAVCFNTADFFTNARLSYPECDFIKLLAGIETVYNLFEDRPKLSPKEQILLDKLSYDDYQEAVFCLLDEKYGKSSGFMQSAKLFYKDPESLVYDENKCEWNSEKKLNIVYNPAAKSANTGRYETRHMRMELFNMLNGKTIPLIIYYSNSDKSSSGENRSIAAIIAGNYQLIPWLSNGTEHTIHSKPFDRIIRPIEKLYSKDIQERKSYLNMEYRFTKIPVNCVAEYLVPSVYYTWLEREILNELVDMLWKMAKEVRFDNADELMKMKKKVLRKCKTIPSDNNITMKMESIMDLLLSNIQKEGAITRKEAIKQLKENLTQLGIKESHLYDEFIVPLVCGEELYRKYVLNNTEADSFDFSCVSILYYTALESMLSEFLFRGYLKHLNILDKTYMKKGDIQKDIKQYWNSTQKIYNENYDKYYFNRSVELGRYKYFYCEETLAGNAEKKQTPIKELKEFVEDVLNITTEDIITYCKRISEQTGRRNAAAHGMNIISLKEIQDTKRDVYSTKDEVSDVRGLIIDFLKMVNCALI